MIGKTISHYKILEKLGEGGMGQVYKAEDTKLKRIVALKFLPHHLVAGKSIKERFFHEAQSASALNHPNIITIYDIHEEEGEVFLAMECVDGVLLSDKLKDGPLKQTELISIATGIADGLNAAHNADITHRDIKSENIFITKDGLAKIIDFGLAKQKGMSQITQDGTTLGTQGYMSPEQVQGVEADRRSDIFSFGVVLYQMATGKLPFEGEHEAAVLYSIVNEAPIPVTTHNPNLDEELQRIINKALEKDVKDRYQHADDLLADLRKLKKGKPPKPTKAKAPVWRIPAYISGALILCILIYFSFFNKPDDDLKSIAVLPFTSIDGTEEGEIFSTGMHDDILSQVAKIHDLKVVSRTSVMRYKDTDKNMREIAQELGVETILEGSVRRVGDKVRIVAQLINAKTDEHLWTETYDRDYVDIFAIQTDVAEKIALALKATLTPEELSTIEKAPTENMEAYDYYLKGKYYWDNKSDRDGNMRAAELLEKAVELDPSFTLAYALLAQVNFTLYQSLNWDPTPERLEKGKDALEQATHLNPDLPEVHLARARYYVLIENDHKKALIEYLIALKERPNDSEIVRYIGQNYGTRGKWEKSEEYLLKAHELDPRDYFNAFAISFYYSYSRNFKKAEYYFNLTINNDPEQEIAYEYKVWNYLYGYGDVDNARKTFEQGMQNMDPTSELSLIRFEIEIYGRNYQEALEIAKLYPIQKRRPFFKGTAHYYLKNESEAKNELDSARVVVQEQVKENPGVSGFHSRLGHVYAMLGMKEDAIREGKKAVELTPITKNAYWGPAWLAGLANIYIITGEHDKAIELLEQLLSIPSYVTKSRLKTDPRYDPLRDNPRFQELIEKYKDTEG